MDASTVILAYLRGMAEEDFQMIVAIATLIASCLSITMSCMASYYSRKTLDYVSGRRIQRLANKARKNRRKKFNG